MQLDQSRRLKIYSKTIKQIKQHYRVVIVFEDRCEVHRIHGIVRDLPHQLQFYVDYFPKKACCVVESLIIEHKTGFLISEGKLPTKYFLTVGDQLRLRHDLKGSF